MDKLNSFYFLAHLLIYKRGMNKCTNGLIKEVFDLSRQMIILADEGNAVAQDDGCRLLFSVLGDCAYKLRMEAQREKEAHISTGKWVSP